MKRNFRLLRRNADFSRALRSQHDIAIAPARRERKVARACRKRLGAREGDAARGNL